MKNKEVFIIIGFIIVLLILAFVFGKNDNSKSTKQQVEEANSILERAQKESEAVKEEEKKELKEITVDEYLDIYSGEENKIVLVARPTCHYCQIAEPIIQKLAKEYDLEINYLNTDNFQDDDEDKFVSSNEKFSNGFGTPILLSVGNSTIVDSVDGLTDTQRFKEFFEKNGYID